MFKREDSHPAERSARAALLVGTALGCSIAVLTAGAPAFAGPVPNNACGAVTKNASPGQDQVTCTPTSGVGNTYTGGISYDESTTGLPVNDLTVVLQGGASPATVNTLSTGAAGVVATGALNHNITVISNSGASVTAGAGGIYAVSTGTGVATAKNYGSVTAVGAGVRAYNSNGGSGDSVVVNTGTVSVTGGGGSYAIGLSAGYTNGNASVTNSGAVTATATRAVGIGTDAYTSSTVVNNAGGTIKVTGVTSATGINAGAPFPQPAGTTSVTNYADITVVATGAAGTATGISATSYNGATVVSKSGKISASGYNAFGVSAVAAGEGSVLVNISGGSVGAYASGTSSPAGAGIYAKSTFGTTTVYGSTTNTTGIGITGIKAIGDFGTYVTTGAVTTTGKNALGVDAYSRYGPTSVTVSGAVKTSGDGAVGVRATTPNNYGYGTTVTLNASVKTLGKNADAVDAYAKTGDVWVTGAGAVSTIGDGSFGVQAVSGTGDVHVALTGPVSTAGKNAGGIVALSGDGAVSVSETAAVTTTGANSDGVTAVGDRGVTVNLSGPVSATGANSTGVIAIANHNNANVTVGSVTANSTGVIAIADAGAASVTVKGAVSSATDVGVVAIGDGTTSTVTVATGASVNGAFGGIVAISTGGNATVNNGGTVGGGKYSVVAVSSKAGATLNNYAVGVVNGPVTILGKTSSTFNNAGVWNASGTSYIGNTVGGVVNNSGVVNVAPGTSAATTVTVTKLATWNNTGSIDLRNGHTGDVLALGTAAFVGGTGSTLKLDASLSDHVTADKVTAGAVTGATVVNVADTTPSAPAAFDFTGATIFQGTSGTQSNFALPGGGYIHKGFVDYAIYFNPTAVTWNLVGLPGHAVFEALKLPQAAQGFSERSDEAWYGRVQEVRDSVAQGARGYGWELWGQVYGGEENLNQTEGFAFSPFHFAENLSTRNSWVGVQFGADHLSAWKGGKLLYGFTAGYLEQWTDFRGGETVSWGAGANAGGYTQGAAQPHDRFDLHGANVGAYLGYASSGWFVNGLAKADFAGADLHLNSVPLQAATNATVWSVKGEAGYRYGGPSLFIEPLGRISWGDTDVDSWSGAGATVKYPGNENLQSSLGARVGGAWGSGRVVVTPYLGAYWTNEALADNRASVTAGTTTLNLRDTPLRSFARIDAGVTAKTFYGLEGFAKVVADSGSGVSGVSGDLGVRWRW